MAIKEYLSNMAPVGDADTGGGEEISPEYYEQLREMLKAFGGAGFLKYVQNHGGNQEAYEKAQRDFYAPDGLSHQNVSGLAEYLNNVFVNGRRGDNYKYTDKNGNRGYEQFSSYGTWDGTDEQGNPIINGYFFTEDKDGNLVRNDVILDKDGKFVSGKSINYADKSETPLNESSYRNGFLSSQGIVPREGGGYVYNRGDRKYYSQANSDFIYDNVTDYEKLKNSFGAYQKAQQQTATPTAQPTQQTQQTQQVMQPGVAGKTSQAEQPTAGRLDNVVSRRQAYNGLA